MAAVGSRRDNKRRASDDWVARWLAACSDLAELERSNPMTDAVIDEIDGRMIRIGDRWLADFASCNYLGFDLDREIIDCGPRLSRRWGTHPSWSRLLGSPVLYEQIEERLTALVGAPRRARAPDDHADPPLGDPAARRERQRVRRPPRAQDASTRAPSSRRSEARRSSASSTTTSTSSSSLLRADSASCAADLHRRRQQHDGQRPRSPGVRRTRSRVRRDPLRRRRARLRRDRRAQRRTSRRPTACAATASSATSARATRTSCSSPASRRRTRRSPRSSPARRR